MIGLIVARSKNNVIGKNGQIPWRIKGEQKQFKELTTGNVVIMGRKSYEEIGHPLPNRKNIVVSSSKNFDGDNLVTAHSLKEALELAGNQDIFIAGGYGLFKEAIIFLLIFNILRIFAFGLHASKSIWCWISSSISFIGIPYICKTFIFPNLIYIILPIICLVCFILYAPADTVKRPLINSRKRKLYKLLSIISCVIYFGLIIITTNFLIKNLLLFALILESILILPLTYKIFKLPYKNYLNY